MSESTKPVRQHARAAALDALRRAIIEGNMWHYDDLVTAAHAAGVTDEELDLVAHEAVRSLLAGAEEPLSQRDLAPTSHGSRPA
jgi:phosphoglycerate dehydrogenase-like enzyme